MFNFLKQKDNNSIDKYYKELHDSIVKAVKIAHNELLTIYGNNELFGFALGTDDDVSSFYHVACTNNWVKNKIKSYEDIGYIFVEWEESASENIFDEANNILSELINLGYRNQKIAKNAVDDRFSILVSALSDIRNEELFNKETLFIVSSTDPSDHLQSLCKKALYELNIKSIAEKCIKAFN